MKSFKNVYKKSKVDIINEQQKLFNADKARLVAAIKHEYGIADFSSLSESDKASYKALIGKIWSPESGLNQYGVSFINECVATLTDKSTDEQIQKFFKKNVKASIENIINCVVFGKQCDFLAKLKSTIEGDTKKKLSNKNIKQWLFDICCDYVGGKVKSIKLT